MKILRTYIQFQNKKILLGKKLIFTEIFMTQKSGKSDTRSCNCMLLKTLREKSDTMASENGHGFQLELLKVQMLKVHNICFSNPPTDTILSIPY